MKNKIINEGRERWFDADGDLKIACNFGFKILEFDLKEAYAGHSEHDR
jgi:hypothetical protein